MLRILMVPVVLGFALLLAHGYAGALQQQPIPTTTPSTDSALITPAGDQEPQIISPTPGQALQGNVPIVVNTTLQNFQSLELTFTYSGESTASWFLIVQGIQPVINDTLVQWDTSTITDGDYDLRLEVTLIDGRKQTAIVKGIRVRNYSPVETETPTPAPPTATAAPADTPLPTITPSGAPSASPPTATPIPSNPAALDEREIWISVGKGALAIAGLFALGGLYQMAHTGRRRR